MRLNVKQLSGEQFFVDIDYVDSIAKLKSRIEDVSNIPALQQRLIYSGRELMDNTTIKDYNIVEGKTVHLVMRRAVGPSMYGTTNVASASSSASSLSSSSSTMTSAASGIGVTTDLESQQQSPLNDNNDEVTPLTNNNNGIMDGSDEMDGARILDVMELARACRLIRLFAIIDCVLMILFAFWGDLLFLAGVPLAICGYFGAKNLKRGALFIYGVFILLSIAFRIYLAYVYPTWLMILLTVISVLLEVYVLKQTIKLFSMIPRLTSNDQRMLQQMSDMFI